MRFSVIYGALGLTRLLYGVYNSADSGFTMTGGKITNNTAESAGGVYAAGKFDMLGGEISGNTATSTVLSFPLIAPPFISNVP